MSRPVKQSRIQKVLNFVSRKPVVPQPTEPPLAENTGQVPGIKSKRYGHTTCSPLPHDFYRTKPVETINGGKENKEYIRYWLTPEELQALNTAYTERRCQDASGVRSRKRD